MQDTRAFSRQIYLPLLVMLLLTFLVGVTAYQLSDNWQKVSASVTRNMVQTMLISNIRWSLYQIKTELPADPDKAQAHWDAVQKQAGFLQTENVAAQDLHLLRTFLANDRNIYNIDYILRSNVLNLPMEAVQQDLEDLQAYTRFVTTSVTVAMIVLGLVLTAITAHDLDRLFRALMRSRDLNISIQEEERRRIAQDLHDGVVQEMIDLKRNYSVEKVDGIIHNLRRVCHNLKPQVLDDLGLSAALEFLADDLRQGGVNQVQMNLDQEGLAHLPKEYELPLFRVVQELFSNIKNHARASTASLTLVYNPEESPMLRGYIRDNGKGFDPAAASQGMGLAGVRERIEQLGGRLIIESSTESATASPGSTFQFLIPVKTYAPNA